MMKLWKCYQKCLSLHPFKTQIISSGVLWGVGDIVAQFVTHSTAAHNHLQLLDAEKGFTINWRRTAITSIYGLSYVGPVGHFWFEGLDKFIRLRLRLKPKTTRFVATKVAADCVFCPFDLIVFFSYMGFTSGKNAAEVKEDIKRDFLPTLVVEGGAWPIVQVVNFRYVPVRYQLLYVNMFYLLDSAFLSWVEQQKDAAWKQWFTYSSLSLKEKEGGDD